MTFQTTTSPANTDAYFDELLPALKAIRDYTESLDYEDDDLIGQVQEQEEALDAIRDIAYFRIHELENRQKDAAAAVESSEHESPRTSITVGVRPDSHHPQFQRLWKAFDLIHEVIEKWDEKEVASYPDYLPSFDEYVSDIEAAVFEIEWK
jgi:hypothetical protein